MTRPAQAAIKAAWAAALAGVLGATIAVTLNGVVRDVEELELADEKAGWPAVPLPMQETTGEDGVRIGRLTLWRGGEEELLQSSEIHLVFGNNNVPLELVQGTV